MKLNLTEKDISILKGISQVAGGFTLVVALTMIFSLIQLKTINPLDNPVLLSVKDQYDKDPADAAKAEQVRALDLMARKAYFSSRWQAETGSYLLLAGAIVFIFCQRLISNHEKLNPILPGTKYNPSLQQKKSRKYLITTASVISLTAIIASFILRTDLPDLSGKSGTSANTEEKGNKTAPKPDKTNFPFFRGQDSRGVAGGSGYPTEWDGVAGKNIHWKIQIPKQGKSSPVIWGDKIFITGAQDMECEVYCINKKTGDILWIGSASNIPGEPTVLPKMDQEAGLAVSTVATNGKEVCAIFANGTLICFDMDGKQKWAKNIGVPESIYGYSSSLIIYQNLLLVQYDSEVKISLIGFDIETGEQKWETLRQGRAVWSSPVLAYFEGKPQVILNGNPMVSSYDPSTGKELWAIECLTGDVAPSVAVNSTMAFAVTDYAKLAAVKPGTGASIIWEDNTYTPDVSSPVATDDFLFISTGNGDVACYNSGKGDTLWTHYFMDQFYSSPIIADDMVYLLDRSGVMHIVKAKSEFQLVAEAALGERTDCTPAFSDKKIYIRGKKNLYCISNN
ncbi:MAG: PQQ-binding-like beta-propeller repeat protein [Bacteroidia bacterium]|nr:PQQ-binding-like beta-propeller repeat protein [Bacteroidia bacterium]